MEQFSQNFEPSPEESKVKKDTSKLKQWIGAGILAGAAIGAVGCEDKTSTTEQSKGPRNQTQAQNEDWVEKKSDEIDRKFQHRSEDLQEAKLIAAKKAILISNSDKIGINKVGDVIVEVTVNGKMVPLSEDDYSETQIRSIKTALEFTGEKYPPPNWSNTTDVTNKKGGGEIKTNPDAEEFLK